MYKTMYITSTLSCIHAVYGILCAGVAVSVLAFVLAPQNLTFVAGAICVAK
jgi:hypothetical protein